MQLLSLPKRLFYEQGSRLAIFLVKRRIKKRPNDPGLWLVLTRLYEVRSELPTAVQTLERALTLCPHNPALKLHLDRLRAGHVTTFQ